MDNPSDSGEQTDTELWRTLDAATRAEMEVAEQQAAELAARQRGLVDVCWQAVQSGGHLAVRIGEVEVGGLAIYARGDLLTLETTYGVAEVNLRAIDLLSPVQGTNDRGRAVPKEAESFVARLALLQLGSESIELITRGAGWRGEGQVNAVARDHLVLHAASGTRYVQLDAIACVLRRPAVAPGSS